jgi:hypothetical protein
MVEVHYWPKSIELKRSDARHRITLQYYSDGPYNLQDVHVSLWQYTVAAVLIE